MINNRLRFAAVVAVVLSWSVEAATRTWAGGSGSWTNPANWVGGVAPSPGDDLVFQGAGFLTATNDFPAGTAFRSISIVSGSWNLAGNAIVLGEGGITAATRAGLALPITLSASQSWTFNAHSVVNGGTNSNGHTLTITANAHLQWEHGTGTGSVIVGGSGDLNAFNMSEAMFALTLNDIQAILQALFPGPVTVTGNKRLTLEGCATQGSLTMPGGELFRGLCSSVTDLTMGPGARFRVLIENNVAALEVRGTVTLGGATLHATTSSSFGIHGRVQVLIDNDGTDAVNGTFAGLAEGSVITIERRRFQISYRGGDGNDVVLVELPPPSTTFVVTNLNDAGAGSLRQAVLDANATTGFDTITFQSGLTSTITLTSGEIAITESVRILGPQNGGITVSGNNASRIFSANASEVTITNLTLTNGSAAQGGAIDARVNQLVLSGMTLTQNTALTGNGGALRLVAAPSVSGPAVQTLLMSDSIVTGNSAPNGDGGGIWHSAVAGEMNHVTLTDNQAGNRGGGMFAEVLPSLGSGILDVRFSTVAGNESCRLPQANPCGGGGIWADTRDLVEHKAALVLDATNVNGNNAHPENGGSGGGLYCTSSPSAQFVGCHVRRSAVWGNNALHGGGTYALHASVGLTHSTVVSNTASGNGGGAYFGSVGNLTNATVAANQATADGGGVYFAGSADRRFTNSIVADNASTAGAAPDVGTAVGVTVPVNYSLVRTPGTASIAAGPGYLTGVDPQLGPLQVDPGSPTPTRDPAPASPVVNAGDPAFTATGTNAYDQRFYPRIAGGRVDMGAVEVQSAPAMADLSVNKNLGDLVFDPMFAKRPESYTITVANAGPAVANGVILTDQLPAGARILGIETSQGTCTASSATTTCDLGSIVAGLPASVTVHFIIDVPGTYPTTASVTTTSPDTNPADNSRSTDITIQPNPNDPPRADLTISQSVSPSAPIAGEPLFFVLTVRNDGPDRATNVVVTDDLPPNATFVEVTSSQGNCIYDIKHEVVCSLGTLGSGQSATITIEVTPQAGQITNTAMVNSTAAGGTGDPAFGNNVSATTVVASTHASEIPTASEWALILLAAAMALAGWVMTLRR